MAQPEWISGNIFIRANVLEHVGDAVARHAHQFDHTTIVWEGAVHVAATLPDGTRLEREFRRGEHFLVRAHVEHAITALEDGTVFWCVYAHRDPQGRVTQEYTGWERAYA